MTYLLTDKSRPLIGFPDSLRLPQSQKRGGAPLAGVRRAAHRSHHQPVREHVSREEMPADHHGVVGSPFYCSCCYCYCSILVCLAEQDGTNTLQHSLFTLVSLCVSDSMEGGELFSRIQAKGDQAFTEKGESCADPEHIAGKRGTCCFMRFYFMGVLPV